MEADGRGHFIGEFRLNGRAAEAMIDTGASAVAINRSTARRIGLSPANSDFIHPVSTANGTTHAAQVLINRIEIGGIAVRDVPALVLEDTALSGTLIGMSFLSKLRRYQVENGRLFLEQ
jgi:aspartyl protease family protein